MGKSTIGEYLSLEKQLSFIDLDVYIEIKENKTIPEIFEEVGEIGFRKIEYNYLTNAQKIRCYCNRWWRYRIY